MDIFFSNRLEILYQQLKESLFGSTTPPLMRRLVVVYGPAMKTWLMLRMAQDPALNVATGIEFLYLNQAFESLLKLSTDEYCGHFPTFYELALAIEKELMSILRNFQQFDHEEQADWTPLIQYLNIPLNCLDPKIRLSRKAEKRLISLSHYLARLFQDYGRFAPQMMANWKLSSCPGWQPRLWCRLFEGEMEWTYPSRALLQNGIPKTFFTVYFFSISFVTASEFIFLNRLSAHVPIHYYLLSSCAVFWSDIRSDRERAYLQTYWEKKFGAFSSKVMNLEELLRDRNPLLANFGRMGREMASQIEESDAITHAQYVLPLHVKRLGEEFFLHEDLYFFETGETLSLLHAIQADLLVMRNPQGMSFVELDESTSIQLHVASSKRREIQILYHNLLNLIAENPSLYPEEIIVMAPQINDYVPYIQSIFGAEGSLLDFQVLDLGLHTHSEIVQGFLQLFELCESRWNSSNVLQLFEHPCFQRRHQLTPADYATIQEWVEEASICWGEDWLHRNELLRRSHCKQGMVEETMVGTWDHGVSRLLFGLTTVVAGQASSSSLPLSPCSTVDFSQGELLGKWIHLLHALRDDLSPLEDKTQMTMDDWVNFLICLLDHYFQPNFEDRRSIEEYDDLKSQLEVLRHSVRFFKEEIYPFASVKAHILSLLQERGMTYREEHLQSIRFCSLVPLRSIPAKVVALIGMQEGSFPRSDHPSSLNLMIGSADVDYCPLSTDYDRYLFLEALHSAQDYLLLSYQGYSQQENKELRPSLLIEELFSYLDKNYTINGKTVSEVSIFKHPHDSFDARYFSKEKGFSNYSCHDFKAAQTSSSIQKETPHCFFKDFMYAEDPNFDIIENHSQIDIRHLSAVFRNPIKFHLNRTLEIYIQTEEDRKLKTEEELIVSSLDKYQIKHQALKEPIENILHQAESEGKLPFGLFKTVATHHLKEEIKDIYEQLSKHSVNPNEIFQIEFCASCVTPTQLEKKCWLFPPVVLNFENGHQLSIVGRLPYVSSKGLIILGKGNVIDALKAWPQFLLYCHAAKLCPEQFEPQLIMTQAAEPKRAFFDDPHEHFHQLIHYYVFCLNHFSPLLPDWIPTIMDEDVQGLDAKMKDIFSESFGSYQNHDLQWVFNKHHLPSSESIIQCWKPLTEKLVGDVIRLWYPSKKEKSSGDV